MIVVELKWFHHFFSHPLRYHFTKGQAAAPFP